MPDNMKKRINEIALLALSGVIIISFSVFVFYTSVTVDGILGTNKNYTPEKTFLYGIQVDSLDIVQDKVKPGQNLSDLLKGYGIDNKTIDLLIKRSAGTFDLRKIKSGNDYTLLSDRKNKRQVKYFIYENTPLTYVIFTFTDKMSVSIGRKEMNIKTDTLTGIIRSSLWNALAGSESGIELALKTEDIFGWSVDFFGLQKGDHFKVIYEKLEVGGKTIGIQRIKAAVFNHYKKDIYAFWYAPDSSGKLADYFDDMGNSLRRAFLKSPLKFSRISSHFTGSRFHPVLKIYRAHHGVDYAAPKGTPVFAIGDGMIVAAGYSGGAGNMVKVRHNSVYTTQYCHFSKIATGIRSGVHVKQGQVIGYVGSTGLSTGPHLDFRFYKNGSPVNPLRVESPPTQPVPEVYRNDFRKLSSSLKTSLAGIKIKEMKYKTKPVVPFMNAFDFWPFNRL